MARYRMYKLRTSRGGIVEGKDMDAPSHSAAMAAAAADDDCPICEIWQGAEFIGKVDEQSPN